MSVDATAGLSLASLNLHGGRGRTGEPYSVIAALHALSSDVVVLQENWRPHGSDSIASRAAADCGYTYIEEIDVLNETTLHDLGLVSDISMDQPGAWGLAVLSRAPLVARESVWLGAAPGDMSARAAQVVEVREPRTPPVRLANVHLTHRLAYGPSQLRRLIGSLATQQGPTVLAGDFNMCRPTIYLARGFRRAVRGRTWPAHRPMAQLDHVLTSPGISVVRAEVLPTVGSDHLAVRVVLQTPLLPGNV